MNKVWLLAIATLSLIAIQGCKKDKGDDTPQEELELFHVYQTLMGVEDQFEANSTATSGNIFEAMTETANWALLQTDIASAELEDTFYLHLTTTSGIRATFWLDETDENGKSLYRGAGNSGGTLKQMASSGNPCSNDIENRKVLIYAPAYSEFYTPNEMQHVLDLFEQSEVGFDVTLKTDDECLPEMLNHFGDYGFVIIDAHGFSNAVMTGLSLDFSQGELPTTFEGFKSLVTNQIGPFRYEQMVQKELILTSRRKYQFTDPQWWENGSLPFGSGRHQVNLFATEQYVQASPEIPNTVVFGNFCWSGQTYGGRGIGTAFIQRNPISYFAYAQGGSSGRSQVVADAHAKNMEDSLIRALTHDYDSTGIAHLKSTGEQFRNGEVYLKQWNQQDYCYCNCLTSFTDSRDGQTYPVTCIGDQIWMAKNLNYASGGMCYDHNPNSCQTFGRLYTWDEVTGGIESDAVPSGVQGICPEGWHVPSTLEWQELINFVGGSSVAGTRLQANSPLWVDADPGTDDYGFAALPAGECDDGDCFNEDDSVGFWTTSRYSVGSNRYYFMQGIPSIIESVGSSTQRFSCRCVKDE